MEVSAVGHDSGARKGGRKSNFGTAAQVRAHPEIEWVWFDFWSMPQGERTAAERIDFKHMLVNINVLYLGMRVLILLDL